MTPHDDDDHNDSLIFPTMPVRSWILAVLICLSPLSIVFCYWLFWGD